MPKLQKCIAPFIAFIACLCIATAQADTGSKNIESKKAEFAKIASAKLDSTKSDSAPRSTNDRPKEPFTAYNGTTYILKDSDIKGVKTPPLKIGEKPIKWLAHPKYATRQIAIIPIAYRTKPGTLALSAAPTLALTIKPGNYKKEQITISDASKVKPDEASLQRIARERDEANAIYADSSAKRYWREPFAYPLRSTITSPFGSARVFNGELQSFHGGVDFRAPTGTPLHAVNDGVVALAKERFLAGKSVIIDHGEGLYSTYFHCSELKVKVGDAIKKGDLIALSGASGRVSGAHLHFGIVYSGVQVDPLDFITAINALFAE
ncbi:M23 family metallopeptidase [Helicobacter sp. CLO-3]|uniref:M23 family metallopeptidase n=1 Tax=Helicobacter sp. CLO-3 TaxID=211 RepID=UPI0009EE8182|nr:M23 family metallopeptidase [Helicobacter sp. CLO-3]